MIHPLHRQHASRGLKTAAWPTDKQVLKDCSARNANSTAKGPEKMRATLDAKLREAIHGSCNKLSERRFATAAPFHSCVLSRCGAPAEGRHSYVVFVLLMHFLSTCVAGGCVSTADSRSWRRREQSGDDRTNRSGRHGCRQLFHAGYLSHATGVAISFRVPSCTDASVANTNYDSDVCSGNPFSSPTAPPYVISTRPTQYATMIHPANWR
jgi:hypothetical protein